LTAVGRFYNAAYLHPKENKMNAIRKKTKRVDWLILAGLLLLSAVPVIAGAVRIVELTGNAEITPQNARFFASPLPVVLHIVSVTLYSILGAFQFVPGIRRRKPGWHRAVGKWILVPSGLSAALTGLWMARFYPWPDGDGVLLYWLRLFFGSAMVLSIILGAVAIRRRDYAQRLIPNCLAAAPAKRPSPSCATGRPWRCAAIFTHTATSMTFKPPCLTG
jgi:hypothetical protein